MLKNIKGKRKAEREREGVFVYDSFYGMIEYLFQILHKIGLMVLIY